MKPHARTDPYRMICRDFTGRAFQGTAVAPRSVDFTPLGFGDGSFHQIINRLMDRPRAPSEPAWQPGGRVAPVPKLAGVALRRARMPSGRIPAPACRLATYSSL